MRKILSITLSISLLAGLFPSGAFAQNLPAPSDKSQITSRLVSHFELNNTGFKSNYKNTHSKYDLSNAIPAAMRYIHDTPEVRHTGIHGLYPAPYSLGVADAVSDIRYLASIGSERDIERNLVPVLSNPYVHEAVYIEALIALAKVSDPALNKVVVQDLNYLKNYKKELIYGSGKEYDAALRSRISAAAGDRDFNAVSKANTAQFNLKKEKAFNYLSYAMLAYAAVSGVKGAISTPKAAPAKSFEVIRGGGRPASTVASNTNFRIYQNGTYAAPKVNNNPTAGNISAAYNGNAALKLNTQVEMAPMRVIRPQVNPTPAVSAPVKPIAPIMSGRPQVTGKTTMYIGDPIAKDATRRYSREQLEQKIKQGYQVTEDDLRGLSAGDAYDLSRFLNRKTSAPSVGVLGISNQTFSTKTEALSAKEKKDKEEEIKDVTSISHVREKPVWVLKKDGKSVFYVKYGPKIEIETLKSVHQSGILSKPRGIKVLVPQVITESLANVPSDMHQMLYSEEIEEGDVPFIMDAIDASGFWTAMPHADFLVNSLADKPISQREWDEVVKLFKDFNAAGIYHTDIRFNMFIKRIPATGQLQVSVIDFCPHEGTKKEMADMYELQAMEHSLIEKGLKVNTKTAYPFQSKQLTKEEIMQRAEVSVMWANNENFGIYDKSSRGFIMQRNGAICAVCYGAPPSPDAAPLIKNFKNEIFEPTKYTIQGNKIIFELPQESSFLQDITPLLPQ